MGEHEGVAIGRAALDFLHADDAVGAGLVVGRGARMRA